MDAQVVKWGNGQGIRIPKLILDNLGIQINDKLRMEVRDNKIILEKENFRHKTLEERAQVYGGKLGPYTEFDWGEPQGREVF